MFSFSVYLISIAIIWLFGYVFILTDNQTEPNVKVLSVSFVCLILSTLGPVGALWMVFSVLLIVTQLLWNKYVRG